MANYTCNQAIHKTLTANAVDTVTVSNPTHPGITIVNRTGTAEIYVTLIFGTITPPVPTVGGADCYVLPAAVCSLTIPTGDLGDTAAIVSLVSAGAMAYSVEGLS